MDKYDEIGDLPIRTALVNVNKIFDAIEKVAEEEDDLETILSKIRKVETDQSEWVKGYAGGWRYQLK